LDLLSRLLVLHHCNRVHALSFDGCCSLTSKEAKEGVAEESNGAKNSETKVGEEADAIEELSEGVSIAASGDAVTNASSNPDDEHTPEVDPNIGFENRENDELDKVLGDETTEDTSKEHVTAAGAEPSIASLFSHFIDIRSCCSAFDTTLELNITNLFDR